MLRFVAALAAVVITLLALVSVLVSASCSYGIDVSVPVSQSDFSCLAGQGIQFVIVRAYRSDGSPDYNAPATISAAQAAGISSVDAYLFPCASQSPARMIQQLLSVTPASSFGTLWLDIESNPSGGCSWSGDTNANCQILSELISAAQSAGLTVGVYSSYGEWGTVMESCTAGADAGLPVWYARYNNVQGYSDWVPFGGWSSSDIAMHQYADTIGGLCSVSADANCIDGAGPNPNPPPPPPPPGPASSSTGGSSNSNSGGCMQFWTGLCGGDSNCLCTTGAQCLTKESYAAYNVSLLKNAAGGCAGQCMEVITGECPGSSTCLQSSGQTCG